MTRDDRPPNPRRVITWCILTWVSSTVGVVTSAVSGNWPAALFALNAAILAAGWWLACSRWAAWQALALSAEMVIDRWGRGEERDP